MLDKYFPLAYTPDQVHLITRNLPQRIALATRLIFECGLLPEELHSLTPPGEETPSPSVDWMPDRFSGRDGFLYTVTSPDSVVREILVSHELGEILEDARRHGPGKIPFFELSGASSWETAFENTSTRLFGWTHGATGLRQGYARLRLKELTEQGFGYYLAMALIGQEMGCLARDRNDQGDPPSAVQSCRS